MSSAPGESADAEILLRGPDMAFSSPGCRFLSARGLSGAPASSRGIRIPIGKADSIPGHAGSYS